MIFPFKKQKNLPHPGLRAVQVSARYRQLGILYYRMYRNLKNEYFASYAECKARSIAIEKEIAELEKGKEAK